MLVREVQMTPATSLGEGAGGASRCRAARYWSTWCAMNGHRLLLLLLDMLTWPQMKLAAVLMPTKSAAPTVELDTLGTFYVLPEACHSHRHSTPTKELSPAGNVVHGDWTSAKRIPSGFRRC